MIFKLATSMQPRMSIPPFQPDIVAREGEEEGVVEEGWILQAQRRRQRQ